MSKQNVIRLINQQEHKQSDTLERIYWHMLDPIYYPLNPTEEGYFDDLKKVFFIMSEEMEERRVRKKLHAIMSEKEHYFTKMMNDVEQVFGKMRKVSKDFQRSLQRERIKGYIRHLSKSKSAESLAVVVKYEELLMKLDGLHVPNSEGGFDWKELQLPPVTFSSARAFLSDGAEDIEIIEDAEV